MSIDIQNTVMLELSLNALAQRPVWSIWSTDK